MSQKTPDFSTPIPPYKSIRWRLLALLAVMILATLMVIGTAVYWFIFTNEQQTWQARQTESARHAAETVATFVKGVQDTLTVVSLLQRDTLVENPEVIDNLLQENTALQEIVRLDEAGQVLAGAFRDNPLLANLFTIPQARWFTQSKAGELYLGSLQISPNSEPYVIIAIPAADGGAVAARLQMNVLWNVVARLNFGETGQAYLVNADEQIVAHTDENFALERTSLKGRPEVAAMRASPDKRWSGTYQNFEGNTVIGVTTPVEGTNWIVFTEVAQAEAARVSQNALFLFGVGMIVFGVLVMFVTSIFLRRLIFRPMEQLREGAARIGQGDLRYQINLSKQDEVGQVADAFDQMVKDLRERDAQIIERTEALKASEDRFRQVISSISDHIYMTEITREGDFINRYLSPNITNLTGYPRETLIKDWFFWGSTIIHPDDREAAKAQLDRFIQGQNSEVEYKIIKAGGEIVWVRDNGQVEKGGNKIFIYGVISDITARKEAEQALQRQQAFLQQVIDINPHFIFAKDRQGRFTLANLAFANAYRTTVDQLIGKTDNDFHPYKEQVDKYSKDDMSVITTGKELIFTEELVTNVLGEKLWRYTIKRPILDENGVPFQVLGVATDITDRKHFEGELARARDEALEASHLKTQLLANVSHDLRTPMGAVIGYAEMLQAGVFGAITKEQMSATGEIIDSARQLLNFINNLLDQARIDAGKVSINIVPVNVANLLQNVETMLKVVAQTKGIQLSSDIASDVPATIPGDPHWLDQILVNLVSNAIKFTNQGSVHVHIFIADDNHWGMQVSDTGAGIPEEAQYYIFEPFRQVDGTVTRKHGGAGLGLSIVKQLIVLMEGDIQLKSVVGHGSTFTVTLPLLEPIKENLS